MHNFKELHNIGRELLLQNLCVHVVQLIISSSCLHKSDITCNSSSADGLSVGWPFNILLTMLTRNGLLSLESFWYLCLPKKYWITSGLSLKGFISDTISYPQIPMDHMSTLLLYPPEVVLISGALYNSVPTSLITVSSLDSAK